MKIETVFVVTRTDAGWDCVVGVFKNEIDAYKYLLDYDSELNNSDNLQDVKDAVDDSTGIVHGTQLYY